MGKKTISNKKKSNKPIAKSAKPISQGEVWNLDEILGNKSIDSLLADLRIKIDAFTKFRQKLNDNISVQDFKDMIVLKEDITVLANKIGAYYQLRFAEDSSDQKTLSELTKIKQLLTELSNNMIFFTLWFMHIDDKAAKRLIDAKELSKYRYFLLDIRKLKPYTKTEEIEQIMNLKDLTSSEALTTLYELITNSFVYDFNGKKINEEELRSYTHSKDAKLRKHAYDALLNKYSENSTVLNEIYKDIIMDWGNEVKIRHYKSPINVRNINNDIDDKAVEAMMNVVKRNAPLFTEYFRLKQSLNNRSGDKYPFSRYHLYAPYNTKISEAYDYEKSKQMVLSMFNDFDKRFYDAAKNIFEKKHVHSHPMQNKRGGAFCECISTDILPYLLLNHTGKLRDVFTMAHELGHGIHYTFSRVQSNFTYHASLPMAETASTFAEMLLAEKLLKESGNDEIKKYIIIQNLDNNYAKIIRQVYFVLFEVYAHANVGMQKHDLEKYYYSLLKEQFGNMEVPDAFKNEWNYIPHIHESPFYCYAYAWGNLLVLALYDMYKKQGKAFVEKYVKLLSYGGGKSPKDMLAELGIDPSDEKFWETGFAIIREEIEELKRLTR